MADVRALLKAKREQRGVAPIPAKARRINLSRAKEDRKGKRKADVDMEMTENAPSPSARTESPMAEGGVVVLQEQEAKRRKMTPTNSAPPAMDSLSLRDTNTSSSGFPNDFFSDPTRMPIRPEDNDEDEEVGSGGGGSANAAGPKNATVDQEWEAFQRAVISAPVKTKKASQAIYESATIFAEPELNAPAPDGFPDSVITSAPGTAGVGAHQRLGADGEIKAEETEEEIRQRKARDEKELLMDRLLDEERAQEEADDKVQTLKARLELLKRKRQEAREKKNVS